MTSCKNSKPWPSLQEHELQKSWKLSWGRFWSGLSWKPPQCSLGQESRWAYFSVLNWLGHDSGSQTPTSSESSKQRLWNSWNPSQGWLKGRKYFWDLWNAGLGVWLVEVLNINLFPCPPPFIPRRIREAGPVNSPTEVRAGALQGADSLGQLLQRAPYTANVYWSPPRTPGDFSFPRDLLLIHSRTFDMFE